MKDNLEQYILSNFQSAIEQHHIQPFYQPVIRTISRQLCSFEALARWLDPELGMITPAQFIPVLEKNQLIHLLDICIIRQVCARIRTTVESGQTPIPVSVNLSRLDFELCDVFKTVDDIVTQYQLPHDFIYIEITESVMSEDEGLMHFIVDKFRSEGYQVWMDDFGSAYSSLNLLKDYEFDELKLDMQFLKSFNLRSQRILSSIIQMAKEIDIHTLAEGVETLEQVRYLRNIGCEKVQGYYFGQPMPYEKALENIKEKNIQIELPQYRKYYDDIGRVNLLSAVPFMSREERESLRTARQLNSIPLAVFEGHEDSFSILFYNTAFENTASAAGMVSHIFAQELLRMPQPYSMMPPRLLNLMESTRTGEQGRMYFVSNEEYYEVQAKCIAQTRDAYSVLLSLNNLSKASKMIKTEQLDESLRQLFTVFERITLMDTIKDSITPLYVATREDLLSGRTGLRNLAAEYAKQLIFQEDRQAYLEFVDFDTLENRLTESGNTYLSRYFRTKITHGQYAWKQYILLRLHSGIYLELIRVVNTDMLPNALKRDDITSEDTASLLWKTLTQSDIIRLFWKDADRRFLGASRGFLDYYGFSSAADIIGRNDEDLGWHLHPESYMNDELRVIHEGLSTHNVPGHCISDGENREIIASKTPIYDENGGIQGLIGFFIDKELLTVNDIRGKDTKRRDMLTGLLNTRGLIEEAQNFKDEYDLRGVDFVRVHVSIDDLPSLNRQYGFDFGDRVISTLGRALKKAFGLTCAVGRYTGHQFAILHQIKNPEDAGELRLRIKQIAANIHQIEGMPLTIYISAGYCRYSEVEDIDEQMKRAELALLADQDEHTTIESRMARASAIFHLYDDLPISYSVYKVVLDEKKNVCDATIFYVNHTFERRSGLTAPDLLGRRTKELFPTIGEEWYRQAKSAAIDGTTIIDKMFYKPTQKWYHMTVSPVIHSGYCCFTYQEMDPLHTS